MDFGIDLSHHQPASSLGWSRFEGAVKFVICRANYGAGVRDRQVEEHIRRARGIGARVGLYLMYRPQHGVQAQWDLFRMVAEQVKLGPGDIVPALSIEHDPLPQPGVPVEPAWSAACEELAGLMSETFGKSLVYITQREWGMLGKPNWVLEHPLWVAHYTGVPKPASPNGVEPTIWQYRIGRFDPNAPGGFDRRHPELDHNRALRPLPLIAHTAYALLPDENLDELRDEAALALFGAHDLAPSSVRN